MISEARPGRGEAAAPRRRGAFGLLGVSILLFGTSWPAMKLGMTGATPIWFAAWRAGLSTVAAFALLLAVGRPRLPTRRDLPIVLSLGLFQLTFFFALAQLGLRLIPAGRSVVLAYTTSLWLVPLAYVAGERIDGRRLAGVLVGLAGVAVLLNPLSLDWRDRDLLMGHGFLLLAALSWAVAIFHTRHHAWHLTPLQVLPWQMLLAAVLLTGLALLVEPAGGVRPMPAVMASLLYLGVFAGPLASWSATSVARALPTLVSSIGFLGVPVVGMIISTQWMGEAITPALVVGAVLILLGVGLTAASAARD